MLFVQQHTKEYPQPDIAKIVTKVETTKTVYKTIKEKVPVYVRDNTCSINRGTIRYFSHQPDNKKLPEAPQILMEKPQPLSYPKSLGTTSGWAEQYHIL